MFYLCTQTHIHTHSHSLQPLVQTHSLQELNTKQITFYGIQEVEAFEEYAKAGFKTNHATLKVFKQHKLVGNNSIDDIILTQVFIQNFYFYLKINFLIIIRFISLTFFKSSLLTF